MPYSLSNNLYAWDGPAWDKHYPETGAKQQKLIDVIGKGIGKLEDVAKMAAISSSPALLPNKEVLPKSWDRPEVGRTFSATPQEKYELTMAVPQKSYIKAPYGASFADPEQMFPKPVEEQKPFDMSVDSTANGNTNNINNQSLSDTLEGYFTGLKPYQSNSYSGLKSKIGGIKELTKPADINRERGFSTGEKGIMIGQGLGALFDAFDKSHEGKGSWKNEGADNLLSYIQNRMLQDKQNKYEDAIRNQDMGLGVDRTNIDVQNMNLGNEMTLAKLISGEGQSNYENKFNMGKFKTERDLSMAKNEQDKGMSELDRQLKESQIALNNKRASDIGNGQTVTASMVNAFRKGPSKWAPLKKFIGWEDNATDDEVADRINRFYNRMNGKVQPEAGKITVDPEVEAIMEELRNG